MLQQLLTFLLPYRATEAELDFHESFALKAYREFYFNLEATGYRDRGLLTDLKRRTQYSRSILLWHRWSVWLHLYRFHAKAKSLKKNVISVDKVAEVLLMP